MEVPVHPFVQLSHLPFCIHSDKDELSILTLQLWWGVHVYNNCFCLFFSGSILVCFCIFLTLCTVRTGYKALEELHNIEMLHFNVLTVLYRTCRVGKVLISLVCLNFYINPQQLDLM